MGMLEWMKNCFRKKQPKKTLLPGRPTTDEIERFVNLAGRKIIESVGLTMNPTQQELHDFGDKIMTEFMLTIPYETLTVEDMVKAAKFCTKWT